MEFLLIPLAYFPFLFGVNSMKLIVDISFVLIILRIDKMCQVFKVK